MPLVVDYIILDEGQRNGVVTGTGALASSSSCAAIDLAGGNQISWNVVVGLARRQAATSRAAAGSSSREEE